MFDKKYKKLNKKLFLFAFLIVTLLYLRKNILKVNSLLSNLKITVPEKIYIKDPESSDLGKRIIEQIIVILKANTSYLCI